MYKLLFFPLLFILLNVRGMTFLTFLGEKSFGMGTLSSLRSRSDKYFKRNICFNNSLSRAWVK